MTKLFEIERKRQLGYIDGLLRSLQKVGFKLRGEPSLSGEQSSRRNRRH